jgi:hypothetical protein
MYASSVSVRAKRALGENWSNVRKSALAIFHGALLLSASAVSAVDFGRHMMAENGVAMPPVYSSGVHVPPPPPPAVVSNYKKMVRQREII